MVGVAVRQRCCGARRRAGRVRSGVGGGPGRRGGAQQLRAVPHVRLRPGRRHPGARPSASRRLLPPRSWVRVGCLCCRLVTRVVLRTWAASQASRTRLHSDEAAGADMCCVMRLYVAQYVAGTRPGCLDEAAGMASCCICSNYIWSTFRRTCSTGPGRLLAVLPA